MEEVSVLTNRTLIKNGIIVTHDKTIFNKDILIENDVIARIDTKIEEAENMEIIDARDCYIMPGLIDLHCHIQDPGYDYKETVASAGQSAIHGGYTTITCNPNTLPCIDNKAIVEYILSKTKFETPVNIVPYGSMTVGCKGEKLAEIGEMQLAGVAAISDGDLAVQDNRLMRTILDYCSMFDIPVITHCEDKSISNGNIINEGMVSANLGLRGAPQSAEALHVMRNILLAEETGAKLHLTHISTAKSVSLIRHFKRQGLKITCETSPQYFTMNEEANMGYNTLTKVNPPLRTEEDIRAIIKGLQDGVIDTISSDHCPDTIDSKEFEFEIASSGMSSLETSFALSYTYLVEAGYMSLEDLVNKMSLKPAQILTLNKGRIVEGAVADLFIMDPNEDYFIEAKKFKSKARYSPYDGLTVKGVIKYTIIDGNTFLVTKE